VTLLASVSQAKTIVIPAGKGDGLSATAKVGRQIVKQLKRKGKRGTKLVYILPTLRPPNHRKQRAAGKLMKKAYKSFQMMEYDKATANAEKALQIEKGLAKEGRIAGYVEAQHLIAAATFFGGNTGQAQRAMNDAYLADPRPPPKKHFSPQIQDLYKQVAGQAVPGTVRLGSTPPGALIWFHKKLIGAAQGSIRIRAGLYLVRAFLPGHGVYQRWFRVHPHHTRDLLTALKKDGTQESDTMSVLRDEATEEEPGGSLSQVALDAGATETILLTSNKACKPTRCRITACWVKEGRWKQRRRGVFNGANAKKLATTLLGRPRLGVTSPTQPKPATFAAVQQADEGYRPCDLDSQCGINEKCVGGRCQAPSSIARKWWFWTLIGVGVAAASVAIVLPLTRPEAPVINVE
jgi:hypothetical protein